MRFLFFCFQVCFCVSRIFFALFSLFSSVFSHQLFSDMRCSILFSSFPVVVFISRFSSICYCYLSFLPLFISLLDLHLSSSIIILFLIIFLAVEFSFRYFSHFSVPISLLYSLFFLLLLLLLLLQSSLIQSLLILLKPSHRTNVGLSYLPLSSCSR